MVNPFLITEKIIPEYFCDRQKESDQLIKYVTNGNNVVLISPRRVGKTGLIQYCYSKREIKDDYITVYVDILSTTNLQEMIFLLGKEIYRSVKTLGARIVRNFFKSLRSLEGKFTYDPISGQPSFNLQLGDITNPVYTLEEIFEYLRRAPKPCIIAIDEFQQIGRYAEKNVEALIRSHIVRSNNCRFIFSGSERHLLDEMFFNASRPFYQSAAVLELEVIPRDIYIGFIIDMFKKGNKNISSELAGEIYDMFDGYTFYVQRLCNESFSNVVQGGVADKAVVEQSLEAVLFSYDAIFRRQLANLSAKQKETLFAIASEGTVEGVTSEAFMSNHSLSSASSVQAAIRALINADILTRQGNAYSVYDRFFSLWIRRNYC